MDDMCATTVYSTRRVRQASLPLASGRKQYFRMHSFWLDSSKLCKQTPIGSPINGISIKGNCHSEKNRLHLSS